MNQNDCSGKTLKPWPVFVDHYIASPGGAGRNKTLGQKEFEKLEFLIPESLNEQQKIAGFLSSIDALVDLQAHKLDELKAYKKGLIQKMLPVMDDLI
ncbi:restriction endonuclease subunit S [Yersinia pseudotuberculosis]|uniref:restriction endonuclease subunit S n=1 Tax=Yersinia pseudotuberculosis TaxID=633 RepID=UPI000BEF4743|nr:restriction endonuclease subunit S [Yersinia pseudotuberculosis]AXY33855.1 restriction endonuclease subunit S [Yersinia pseudotuberculosis]PEI13434.1 hypothetical protein CRM78_09310 [Yersinia pseudotuberculosis]